LQRLQVVEKYGGESGFSKALYYRLFAFNEMPKTAVLTGTYVLPHLEHESHKKR